MEVRKATIDDVHDISRIHALSWKSAYKGIVPQAYLDELKENFWVPAFTEWIKNNVLTVQEVLDNGNAVGCVAYGKSRDNNKPDWGEIVSIYLLPQYFGKGFGNRLMETALSDLKRTGYKYIYLWVLKDNHRARCFYEKKHFKCSNEECTCEIMEVKLTEVRYVYTFE